MMLHNKYFERAGVLVPEMVAMVADNGWIGKHRITHGILALQIVG